MPKPRRWRNRYACCLRQYLFELTDSNLSVYRRYVAFALFAKMRKKGNLVAIREAYNANVHAAQIDAMKRKNEQILKLQERLSKRRQQKAQKAAAALASEFEKVGFVIYFFEFFLCLRLLESTQQQDPCVSSLFLFLDLFLFVCFAVVCLLLFPSVFVARLFVRFRWKKRWKRTLPNASLRSWLLWTLR